jgi:hypothetical protein
MWSATNANATEMRASATTSAAASWSRISSGRQGGRYNNNNGIDLEF